MAELATTVEKETPFAFHQEPIVANAKQVYAGRAGAYDASGNLVPANDATAVTSAGRIAQTVLGDGTKTARVRTGCFRYAAGTAAPTLSNRGQKVYFQDDVTVSTDPTVGIIAGTLMDVDSSGCYVLTAPGLIGSEGATGAAKLASSQVTNVAAKTTTYAVLASDAGGLLQSLTDGEIFNLPASAAATKGMEVTIQNIAADGAALIKIEPFTGDTIQGQIGSVEFGGVASKGIWNTKATQKKGDHARLRADGSGKWWVVGGIGVWASEA